MNESPSKRRKTSPITSVTIPPPSTPKRPLSRDRWLPPPSFMSPTIASIARFNPNLLLQSTSAENKLSGPNGNQTHGSGDERHTESNVGKKILIGSPTTAQKNNEVGSENFATSISNSIEEAGMRPLSPTAISQVDGVPVGPIIVSKMADLDLMLSKQHAIVFAQELRASPPAASEDQESIAHSVLNNQSGRSAEASMAEPINQIKSDVKQIPGQLDEQEPQLPYTPSKIPIGDSEPRLPSTPSQLGLEPPPSPPKGLLLSSPIRRGKRKRRSELNPSPLKPKDLESAETIEKPYKSNLGPRILVNNPQPCVSIGSLCRNNGFKSKSTTSLRNPCINQSSKPSSLSQRLALFLPFSKPAASQQKPASPSREAVSDRTVDSTLPNPLQVISTENTVTSPDSEEQNIRQHDITLTSPQHLLIVKIRLNTDTALNKNTELAVSNLSSWANPELGSWLKDEAINLNKAKIENTIGRYWEISKTRAICWHKCEEQIGTTLLDKSIPTLTNGDDTTQIPQNSHGSEKINTPREPDNPPSSNPPLQPLTPPDQPPIPRHFLLQHLGRQSMLFTRSPVSLLVTWQILIAPQTGDVQSCVAAYAAFPHRWTQSSGGEALEKVGEAFDLLVSQRGVFESVGIICGLIFGS